MILSDVETLVRDDLFDTGATRWTTADIDRGIDKAIDRYSAYYPNVLFADMQMQPYQRTYPYPTSWNASYPVMWLEKVLYPLQVYGSTYSAPANAPTATRAAGSGLGTGVYQYVVTYLTQGGETTQSAAASVTTTGGNQQVNLTNIPLATSTPSTPSIATNTVIGRNIYRTKAGQSTYYLLAAIADNTTTTYLDTTADSALTGQPSPPTVNTSGVMIWPPQERDFSEYSNLFDSNTVLAAGGNMGAMGAVGRQGADPTDRTSPSFTLNISPALLPKDNTSVMRVFYACKHQLDSSGSTIPEIHRDIITLGAVAYCLEAYQVPTNDNFDFQDGGMRDRINDSMIPGSWLKTAQAKMKQFEARLKEIKQQRDFASSSRAHWGDVPLRYSRL